MSLENKVMETMKGIEKTVVIPDMHCPYEDYRALHKIYEFIKEYKPDKIKILGDVVDFYALSSFDKEPERVTSLQEEIDVAQYHFGKIREAAPKADITMFRGNHEYRLVKYLRKHPEMSSLRKFKDAGKLLELEKYDIKYKLNESFHGILIKHGNLVRKYGGYTARGEYENEGTSGMSGHTHRLGSHYTTNRSGTHAWYEMGHVCQENLAEYMEGKVPNWQKGFGTIEYSKKDGLWRVEQIPILNNSFLFRGKVYKWNKNKSFPEREALH